MAAARARKEALLTGGEASVIIGLLEAARPLLSKELAAVADEYKERLDDMTRASTAAPRRPRFRLNREAYQELRSAYLGLQQKNEAARTMARLVKAENAELRGVLRKTSALLGTTGPV